jgi:hypothetical protein
VVVFCAAVALLYRRLPGCCRRKAKEGDIVFDNPEAMVQIPTE